MRRYYGVFLFLFFAYLLLEAVVIGKGYYSVSADDSSRSIIAYNLLQGKMPDDLDWLPLHSIINAGALLIHNDLFWTPRIVSIIFGLLSVAALGHLSYQLFQNTKSLFLTLFFAILYPPHVMFSAVPLTEIMFVFFIAEGMALFISWTKYKKNSILYLSALFFTLSCGVRYEGWIFSFVLMFVLIIISRQGSTKISLNDFVITALIISSVPLVWMALHYYISGNPIGFFSGPQNLYQKLTGSSVLLRLKYNFISNFIFQVLFFFVFPGLIFLLYRYKKEYNNKIFFIIWGTSLLLISVLSISGYGNPSHAFWRIPFTWTYLLIPFLTQLFFVFIQKKAFTDVQSWILVLVPIPLLFLLQTYFLTGYSPFSISEKLTGDYIKELLINDRKSKVLIETSDWNYLHVLVASGQPDRFVYDAAQRSIRPHPFLLPCKTVDLNEFIRSNDIKYIAVQNDTVKSKLNNSGFKMLKSFAGWHILAVQ